MGEMVLDDVTQHCALPVKRGVEAFIYLPLMLHNY